MVIIAVKGHTNSWKSTILNRLIDELGKITKNHSVESIGGNDRKGTFICNNKIIKIYTAGDDKKHLNNANTFIHELSCDIGIIAVNTSHQEPREYWNNLGLNTKDINTSYIRSNAKNLKQLKLQFKTQTWNNLKQELANLGIQIP